jgi:hypothetical protein
MTMTIYFIQWMSLILLGKILRRNIAAQTANIYYR